MVTSKLYRKDNDNNRSLDSMKNQIKLQDNFMRMALEKSCSECAGRRFSQRLLATLLPYPLNKGLGQ